MGGSGIASFAIPSLAVGGIVTTGSNVVISNPPAAPGMSVVTFYSSGTLST
jgi:hypothetical protein